MHRSSLLSVFILFISTPVLAAEPPAQAAEEEAPQTVVESPADRLDANENTAEAAVPEDGRVADEEADGPRVRAGLSEGFVLESENGRQSLQIGGLFSGRATVAHPDGEETSLDATIRLARLMARGRLLGSELTYFVLTEFEGTAGLLDMELTYSPIDELQLRFGRVRVPYGRQWITALNAMKFPDRSVVSDAFRPGRDTGVTAETYLWDGKVEARVGGYAEDGDRWPLGVARLVFAPLGPLPYSEDMNSSGGPARFAAGVNGWYDKRTPSEQVVDLMTGEIVTQTLPDQKHAGGGVDLVFRVGGFAAFAEGYIDRVDPDESEATVRAGTFVQAGYFIVPSLFEVAGRFNLLAPNIREEEADGLRRYELGLSYYLLDGALRLQGRYAYDQVVGAPEGLPFAQGHMGDVQFVLGI